MLLKGEEPANIEQHQRGPSQAAGESGEISSDDEQETDRSSRFTPTM